MVKEGSYVICIDNSDLSIQRYEELGISVDSCTYLTVGKVYNVQHITSVSTMTGKSFYRLKNDNNIVSGYYSNRFISLSESRRLKLERLNKL